MSTIETRMLSWACRVRDFVVEHDVSGDLAELTGVSHDHDETLGQLTADATAAEAITTQSCVQTTEVKRLRLALSEGQLEPIVWTTHSIKREINGDEIAVVLPPCLANSEGWSATSNAMVTTSDAMATALTVLGLQFVARGLASSVLAAAPSSFASGRVADSNPSTRSICPTGRHHHSPPWIRSSRTFASHCALSGKRDSLPRSR